MRSIMSLEGWRLRGLMALSQCLARAGVGKTEKLPLERRAAAVPAPWMLRPMPEVRIERARVVGRDCEIPVKIFRPKNDGPRHRQILFIHGGGWVAGNEDSLDYLCTHLCDGLNVDVTSVGYRLAPEHPFPAGLHDCEDVLANLASSGLPLVIVGDSAGGNLTAALCLKNIGKYKIEKQVLIYPLLDATLSSPSIDPPRHGMSRKSGAEMVKLYCDGVDPRNPLISPVFATELANLPPALIITADCDPLRDDGSRYVDVLEKAGVPVRYKNYLRMPHGFLSLASVCSVAPEAIAYILDELQQ